MNDPTDLTTLLLQVIGSLQSGAYLAALSLAVAAVTLVWNNPTLLDKAGLVTMGKWLRDEEARVPPALGQWIIFGLSIASVMTQALASGVPWQKAISNAVIAVIVGMFGIQKLVALGVKKPNGTKPADIAKGLSVILMLGGMCGGDAGCAAMIGVCKYGQQLSEAEVYTQDLEQQIAAEKLVLSQTQGIAPETLAEIQKLLADAKAIADASVQTEITLNNLCASPDLGSLFNGLLAIYDALEPLIGKVALAPGKPSVRLHEPLIVQRLRKGVVR